MAEHPPPPVITITNPASDAPLSDLIGEEPIRPPRRLTRRQKGWVAQAAVIALVVYGGVWSVSHIRADHRLDRAALTEVAVAPISQPDVIDEFNAAPATDAASFSLILISQGPHPITVRSVDVEGLGSFRVTGSGRLAPDDPSVIDFAPPQQCPASLPDDASLERALTFSVRTYRGGTATRTTPAEATTGYVAQALEVVRQHCGLVPLENSLPEVTAPTLEEIGTDLDVGIRLHNVAKEPRSVRSISVNGGLSVVSADTVEDLPAGSYTTLHVRLRVTRCDSVGPAWLATPEPSSGSFFVTNLGGEIRGTVSDGHGKEIDKPLTGAYELDLSSWLLDRCPDL